MKKTIHLFLICSLIFSATQAFAEVDIRGFATITGGMTLSDDETVYGYDNDVDFDNNSLLGIQLTSDLGDGLAATTQIIGEGADSWNAKLAWAYLSYEATDNVTVLMGRQRSPFFLYSDYLQIGYAYNWVTPPPEAYNAPFSSFSGVNFIISNQLGNAESVIQAAGGRLENGSSLFNQVYLSWALSFTDLGLRAAFFTTEAFIDQSAIQSLIDGWTALGQEDFAGELATEDDGNRANFYSVGANYDNGSILAIAEYVYVDYQEVFLMDSTASYYATLGYHLGSFTPHVTYAAGEASAVDMGDVESFATSQPALYQGTLALVNNPAALADVQVVTAGLRWDAHPSAVLKAEYTYYDDKQADETASLIRFAISTVF